MLNQPITSEQAAALKSFDRWARRLFNCHLPFTRGCPFSSLPHHDASGNILIDRGRMELVMEGPANGYALFSLDEGERLTISKQSSLQQVLLDGLLHAVSREFIETYVP